MVFCPSGIARGGGIPHLLRPSCMGKKTQWKIQNMASNNLKDLLLKRMGSVSKNPWSEQALLQEFISGEGGQKKKFT